jgi:hypothetical protein
MPSHASVKISGPAFRVTAYVINSKILKQLQSATEEDALYEDNPLSMVGNLALGVIRVANGFCIDKVDQYKFELKINGHPKPIKKVGMLFEGCNYEEEFDTKRSETLIACSEKSEMLGNETKLKKTEMILLEFEDAKMAQMTLSFEVADDFDPSEIELGLVDLDVDTDLSYATYHLGLLNEMEKDIRYILHQGQKYDADLEILSGYASDFSLVKRKKDGLWTVVDL